MAEKSNLLMGYLLLDNICQSANDFQKGLSISARWRLLSTVLKLLEVIDIKQHEICHATSKAFHGSSVQTKDLKNEQDLNPLSPTLNLAMHVCMHWIELNWIDQIISWKCSTLVKSHIGSTSFICHEIN